jgi:HSP20 family protein
MTPSTTPRTDAGARTTEPAGVKPRYSVDGDKAAYTICVELPGVKKEHVSIGLDSDVLTIHAKRTSSAPPGSKTLHRELVEDDFTLRLKLNTPVDENKLAAKLEHGVLTLTLPVKDAVKPRTIPVT